MTNAKDSSTSQNDAAGLSEQEQIRREKRAHLLEEGIDPYPVEVPRSHAIEDVLAAFEVVAEGEEGDPNKRSLKPGEETDETVSVSYTHLTLPTKA